jgi:hypothetical protein
VRGEGEEGGRREEGRKGGRREGGKKGRREEGKEGRGRKKMRKEEGRKEDWEGRRGRPYRRVGGFREERGKIFRNSPACT